MNAEQAKQVSRANTNQLAEKQLKEAIKELEQNIKVASSEGLYKTAITVARSGPWKEYSNSRRLRDYFHNLGYGMEVVGYSDSTIFRAF